MATMNLKDYAQKQGISYATARRWFDAGTLPHPARKAGRLILVDVPDTAPSNFPTRTAAYVCVTSPKELEKRMRSVRRWAGSHGIGVDTDAADEDGSHQQLEILLRDPSVTRILTDRNPFTDSHLITAALAATGRELITTSAQPQKPAAPIPFKPRIAQGAGA